MTATPDEELRRIEARHAQDAFWFERGPHDPNGYVVLAHKDREALLERLRTPEPKYGSTYCPRCHDVVSEALCGPAGRTL